MHLLTAFCSWRLSLYRGRRCCVARLYERLQLAQCSRLERLEIDFYFFRITLKLEAKIASRRLDASTRRRLT